VFLLVASICGAGDEEGFLVMAHRGASGYRPEHTLEAYRLAIEMGADYIEPDLVSTKDGILICRHEMNIEGTTDVEDVFPNSFDMVGGNKRWYAYNFTLAEIKRLRARERLAYRNNEYDGLYEVPTLQEVINLVREVEERTGRRIGIYPETKSPSAHQSRGLPLEDKLLAVLYENGYKNDPSEKVFIQSFETDNLKYLATQTKIRLIQLLQGAVNGSPENLRRYKEYAYGVGPELRTVIPAQTPISPTSLVADAHDAGLKVHVWTLRVDDTGNSTLPHLFPDDIKDMYRAFVEAGVDGYFTDFPDIGAEVAQEYFFKISGVTGAVGDAVYKASQEDGGSYMIRLPAGISNSAVRIEMSLPPRAVVSDPDIGSPIDFSGGPVTFIVTTADGETARNVTVAVEVDSVLRVPSSVVRESGSLWRIIALRGGDGSYSVEIIAPVDDLPTGNPGSFSVSGRSVPSGVVTSIISEYDASGVKYYVSIKGGVKDRDELESLEIDGIAYSYDDDPARYYEQVFSVPVTFASITGERDIDPEEAESGSGGGGGGCSAGNAGVALAVLIFIFVMSCRSELKRLRHKYAGRWSQRGASRPLWPGL
jgi:glycerophosphoryl diester phosphodiesterase